MPVRKGRLLAALLAALVVCTMTACSNETTAKDYYQKSFQFINAGSTQDAIDLLALAIAKDPSYFDAYYNRAVLYYCQEKYDKALADLNKAISLKPDHPGAYASRATVYDQLNRADESLADLKTAARLGDSDTQEHLRRKGIDW